MSTRTADVMGKRSDWIDWPAARKTFAMPVLTRSLAVTLVVGTILNTINQGDAIVGGGPVNFFKLALTYAVPFFVASYGAYSAFSRLDVLND